MHEILHVMGFGTLWLDHDLLGSSGGDLEICHYYGPAGTAKYQDLGGCGGTMLTDKGCAHWSETCFQTEVMTPFVNSGSNPLSPMTIGSLADLGYEVDYAMADPFTVNDLNSTAPGCVCPSNGYETNMSPRNSDKVPFVDEKVFSNELREYAVSAGLSILEEANGLEADGLEGRPLVGVGGPTFVGNRAVSVIVEQNHQIGVIVVRRPQQ